MHLHLVGPGFQGILLDVTLASRARVSIMCMPHTQELDGQASWTRTGAGGAKAPWGTTSSYEPKFLSSEECEF